ncbi:snoRNP complex protein nop56 [Coniochaeta pulveracea]|uniref:Nucleolar protein 56 n=1 Tax=Coniochaeta pulveracea TaxID=177199 RepID=A0A420YCH2_9PEZI|nr:snoRNP complex protein nop56 [Coniochaeta pulveracea]
MSVNYLLHESAVGYSLYEVVRQADIVGLDLIENRESINDLSKFSKLIRLVSFKPWANASSGLENINLVSEGIMSDDLKNLLELNLPKTSGKNSKVILGVSDRKLAAEISAAFPGVQCESIDTNPVVSALIRGIRVHTAKLIKDLRDDDVGRAQLGLGHAYSRSKVKFNVHKNDNHIIQGIATLDALDKGINSSAMRVREWYGWHFPELINIVSDNVTYAKMVLTIGNKKTLSEDRLDELANVLDQDKDKAEAILNAAKISMGQDITDEDLEMIQTLAGRVADSADYRRVLTNSMDDKMGTVAPNLQQILGTHVAARLIQHAGSLTNLSKYPASTLQILGAEKALFRALKTKSATPKYGLLYQSSFIGRANPKIKGRISRYLANKCSMASRIDNFSEKPTSAFGEAFKKQIEQRLEFYASGAKPMKNIDAMEEAMKRVLEQDEHALDIDEDMIEHHGGPTPNKEEKKEKKKDKKEKRKSIAADVEMADAEPEKEEKKSKKDKKEKRKSIAADEEVAEDDDSKKEKKKDKKRKSLGGDVEMADAPAADDGEKKKKKKRKSVAAE